MPERPPPIQPDPVRARAWTRRLPRRTLTLLAPLLLGTVLVATAVTGTTSAPHGRDLRWDLGSVAQGATIVSLALLVARPHVAIRWATVASALMTAVTDVHATAWAVLTVALALLAGADTVGALRQRVEASSWHAPVPFPVPAEAHGLVARRRRVALVLGLVGAAVTAGALPWWWADARATEDFRATAVTRTGTVTAVSPDALHATVRVGDGSVTVSTPVLSPEVGDELAVRVSPDGSRAELVADPFDPSGPLFLAGAGATAAVVLLSAERARRRRLVDGLTAGGPVARLVAVPVGGAWVDLVPVEGATPTIARVSLRPVWVEGDDGADPDEDESGDALADHGAWDDDPWGDDVWGHVPDRAVDEDVLAGERVAAMSDAELLELGAERVAAAAAEPWQVLPGPVAVDVHGLGALGDDVVVRTDDGLVLVSDRPTRDVAAVALSWRWRTFGGTAPGRAAPADHRRTAALGALGRFPAGDRPTASTHATSTDAPRRSVRDRAARAARSTGRWLPWPATLLVGAASWWLVGVAPLGVLVGLAPAVLWGYSWATLAQARLLLTPAGVRVRGAVLSELVPWDRLDRVVTDGDGLVLRLVRPVDALLVPAVPDLGPLLVGTADATDAAERLRAGRPAAPATPGPRLVLTPGATVLVAWVCAVVVGGIAA